ncbi:hypothetical protein I3842_06G137800 [Carya illinoinensis]|uniref:Mediator of RNA polymerase II transcription subunit 32 n=1 Tax=Carya illinoinensis TaxID=32201 RepID=A0A922JJ13_CARIL|nr:hypothetical protein I3842_06G137800 [Carya illinoinensis]
MEKLVDSINNAYEEFVTAASNVLEAEKISGGQKTVATNAALEIVEQKWESFRVACDHAEEFVECAKKTIEYDKGASV